MKPKLIKASLLPLQGKYYGTIVRLHFEKKLFQEIKIWGNVDYEPSIRELKEYELTRQDWKTNKLIDNGFGGKSGCRELGLFSDHFESRSDYHIAMEIVKALNRSMKWKSIN
jgi:hypothetical protein